MKVTTMVKLSHDEVNTNIPYAMICETRYGGHWNTTKRRKRWSEEFTEAERRKACPMFKQAHLWYLVRGVPDEVVMSAETLVFWKRLGDFCASL